MDIKKARGLREDLEYEIQELLENFEKKTGTVVHSINVDRIDISTFDDKEKRYKNFINTVTITTEL